MKEGRTDGRREGRKDPLIHISETTRKAEREYADCWWKERK